MPKGKHIYQFSAEEGSFAAKEWLDPDGKYIEHHPGFVKEGSHPDDLGIPCCFKTWDSPEQERRRQVFLENKKVKKKLLKKKTTLKDLKNFLLIMEGMVTYLFLFRSFCTPTIQNVTLVIQIKILK